MTRTFWLLLLILTFVDGRLALYAMNGTPFPPEIRTPAKPKKA